MLQRIYEKLKVTYKVTKTLFAIGMILFKRNCGMQWNCANCSIQLFIILQR